MWDCLSASKKRKKLQLLGNDQIKSGSINVDRSSSKKETHDGNSVFTTSCEISAGILGGPMLLLPRAIHESGLVAGVSLLVITGLATAHTGDLLSACFGNVASKQEQQESSGWKAKKASLERFHMVPYLSMARRSFGRRGEALVAGVVCLQSFCFLAYGFIVSGTNLHLLLGMSVTMGIVVCALVVYPMTLYRGPKEFWWTQALALVLSLTTASMLIGNFSSMSIHRITNSSSSSRSGSSRSSSNSNFHGVVSNLGVFLFAWSGHMVFPTLQMDMREPHRFRQSLVSSYALNISVFVAVGVSGAIAYSGNSIQGNALEAMEHGGMRTAATLCLTLHILLVMVQFQGPVALGLDYLFGIGLSQTALQSDGSNLGPGPGPGRHGCCHPRRLVARAVQLLVPTFMAVALQDAFFCLGDVMGATTATLVAFVFPCAMHLLLCAGDGPLGGDGGVRILEKKRWRWDIALDWFLIIVGAIGGIVATVFALRGSACSSVEGEFP